MILYEGHKPLQRRKKEKHLGSNSYYSWLQMNLESRYSEMLQNIVYILYTFKKQKTNKRNITAFKSQEKSWKL